MNDEFQHKEDKKQKNLELKNKIIVMTEFANNVLISLDEQKNNSLNEKKLEKVVTKIRNLHNKRISSLFDRYKKIMSDIAEENSYCIFFTGMKRGLELVVNDRKL